MLKLIAPSSKFVLAGPQSPRNWWSRLTNPSEFAAWNPLSWSKTKREKGEDKDTEIEMSKILEDILTIDREVQQAKSSIEQLKIRLPKITLDSNNWDGCVQTLQTLKKTIQSNPQYQKVLDILNPLLDNINNIYESKRDLQITMNLLRQRGTVRGARRSPEDKLSSPTEEFHALQLCLRSLYANPFNQEANFYAQRLHARLDDKLRWINVEKDPEIDNWLNQQNQPQTYQTPDITQSPASPQMQTPAPVSAPSEQIDEIVNFILKSNVPGSTPSDKARFASSVLTATMSLLENSGADNLLSLKSLRDALIEVQNNKQTQVGQQQPVSKAYNPPIPPLDEEFDEPEKQGSLSIYDFIKVADELDKIEPNLAQLIDEYIEQYKSNQLDVTLPEFSFITEI